MRLRGAMLLICLGATATVSMSFGDHEAILKNKPDPVAAQVQGKWRLVVTYTIPPNDPARKVQVIRAGVEGPLVLLEFVGRRGIFRKVQEDGSLSKPAPFALDILPNTETDSGLVACDIISYPVGKVRDVLLVASMKVEGDKLHLATAGSFLPADRPKEFKAYRDDRLFVNYDI
ncbi:MAG: hypothetical protein RMJ19_14040, partial [Gemmatales bacterium]|nr:hypothetical protein [Gemmatales bacterium]MDW8176793.1 hypothetical protein [Gemmatales bacterium]